MYHRVVPHALEKRSLHLTINVTNTAQVYTVVVGLPANILNGG